MKHLARFAIFTAIVYALQTLPGAFSWAPDSTGTRGILIAVGAGAVFSFIMLFLDDEKTYSNEDPDH